MPNFFAHGKLLLTAEYLVVKGSLSLAVPTKMGQHLELKEGNGSELVWKALDHRGQEWFSASYDLMGFDCLKTSDEGKAAHLRKILRAVCRDNSDFLSKWKKYRVTTRLDFPRDWGLGSSSTLIHLLSQWAEANPYLVYFDVFDGSGYDIACADGDGPLLYRYNGDSLNVESCDWHPSCINQLYLVHLGVKQDTNVSLKEFLKKKVKKSAVEEASDLTLAFLKADTLVEMEKVMVRHETLVGEILGMESVKAVRFPDFWGQIKSLGAWGGDMALVTSDRDIETTREYFLGKGLKEVHPLSDLVLV